MTELTEEVRSETEQDVSVRAQTGGKDLPIWVSPKLEDVSEQVMAQPYIRFT